LSLGRYHGEITYCVMGWMQVVVLQL